MSGDGRSRSFDADVPNIARVYDYFLGGKDNFAVDRKLAAQIAALSPDWVQACRDNRQFVSRAVTWAAGQGIRSYTAATTYNHTRDELRSFFGTLPLVPPGLALAQTWQGGMADVPDVPPGPAYVLAAVGVKP